MENCVCPSAADSSSNTIRPIDFRLDVYIGHIQVHDCMLKTTMPIGLKLVEWELCPKMFGTAEIVQTALKSNKHLAVYKGKKIYY